MSQCKKHLKHHQSPGVCSVCLVERLSRLQAAGSSFSTLTKPSFDSLSSTLSSADYSCYESSCTSPTRRRHHRRIASDVRAGPGLVSFSGDLLDRDNGLMNKSRSMAFISRLRGGQREKNSKEGNRGKKRGGIWRRLIGGVSRKIKRKENDDDYDDDDCNKMYMFSQPLPRPGRVY